MSYKIFIGTSVLWGTWKFLDLFLLRKCLEAPLDGSWSAESEMELKIWFGVLFDEVMVYLLYFSLKVMEGSY